MLRTSRVLRVKEGEPRVNPTLHPIFVDVYAGKSSRVKGVNLFSNIAREKKEGGYIKNKILSNSDLPFTPFTLSHKSAANYGFSGVHPLYKVKYIKDLQITGFARVNPLPFTPFTLRKEC